jgi:hypothetical protein
MARKPVSFYPSMLMQTPMLLEQSFIAHGHPNIRATHDKTVEVTKDTHITIRGDCIAAIGAEKGLADLSSEMKDASKRPESIISLTIRVGDKAFTATGHGSPELTWNHPTDMVARMSGYTCGRTLMIHSDKATIHMPRALVQLLKDPKTVVYVTVSVKTQ